MLVDTPEGIVNTDRIVAIVPAGSGDGRSIIRLDNGGSVNVRSIGAFERACGVIVPAGPGFDVVSADLPGADETGILYTVESVIAFRIAAGLDDDRPIPITMSGEPGTDPAVIWTVRQPNGACVGPEYSHDGIEAFKAHCERASQRARSSAA